MSETIGRLLGEHLGILEEDLRENPLDPAILDRISRVAGIYANLKGAGLPEFENDFRDGYNIAKDDGLRNRAPSAPGFDMG
ncbi:hypothetical protein ACOTTU_19255 [Roseobacter sp. EG26]|uniref:hypothetical protein n=1 Tax=Roseobacter sp. EG26 TaxID=3412477 RepID=UPI003CE5C404